MGLDNVRNRLDAMFGRDARMDVNARRRAVSRRAAHPSIVAADRVTRYHAAPDPLTLAADPRVRLIEDADASTRGHRRRRGSGARRRARVPGRHRRRRDRRGVRERFRSGEGRAGTAARPAASRRADAEVDGFEVLELVGRDVAVVFVTAYDHMRSARSRCTRSITCSSRSAPTGCRRRSIACASVLGRGEALPVAAARGGGSRRRSTRGESWSATARASTCSRSRDRLR